MAVEGFGEFEQKWLDARPENRVVAVFLGPDQRRRANAFGTLVNELSLAAFHVHQPQIAAAKLAWWRQELADAARGKARHPVTQELFAADIARATDPALWPALAEGALTQVDPHGAGTLAELLEELGPFYGAAARAESALLLGGAGRVEANAALWTFSRLLHGLTTTWHDEARLLLPLNLLARHGLERGALGQPSPARHGLLKDFLGELASGIDDACAAASGRTLTLGARVRLDRSLIAGALKTADPLPYLTHHARAGYWPSLWAAWREARAAIR